MVSFGERERGREKERLVVGKRRRDELPAWRKTAAAKARTEQDVKRRGHREIRREERREEESGMGIWLPTTGHFNFFFFFFEVKSHFYALIFKGEFPNIPVFTAMLAK